MGFGDGFGFVARGFVARGFGFAATGLGVDLGLGFRSCALTKVA